MPSHLLLPDQVGMGPRRQGRAPPGPDPRGGRHAPRLEEQLEDTIAASRRPEIEGVDPGLVFKLRATQRLTDQQLSARGLTFLGETADWSYVVLSLEDVPSELLESLRRYASRPDNEGARAPLYTFFAGVEEIVPYGRDDRRGPGLPDELTQPLVVDIHIWAAQDVGESERRVANVTAVLDATDGEALVTDVRPRFPVVRARASVDGLDQLLDLPVVERIRTPPMPLLEPSDWRDVSIEDLDVQSLESVPVGVIDDEIGAGHPLLSGLVASQQSFPRDYPWGPATGHGTAVAGLVAYGDLEIPVRDGRPLYGLAELHGARVLEQHPDGGDHTRFATTELPHVSVEEAIRDLHADGVRIFNLSVTYAEPFEGPHVNELTETLDALARELDVLVVVAAGNVTATHSGVTAGDLNALHDYPRFLLHAEARVAEPSLASTVVSVGSIARSDGPSTASGVSRPGDRPIARVDEISPFSRAGPGVGPGASAAVKPELVDYGGNWTVSDTDILDTQNVGVSSLALATGPVGRLFRVMNGTSLSAARVTHLAAEISHAYPDASPNLIRALLGLSARLAPGARDQFSDRAESLRAFGYGHPSRELALESGDNRAVMYYEGTIRAESLAIHPVPIPEGFSRGRSHKRIAVALAFDPPVRRHRRGYIGASMRAELFRNVTPDELMATHGRQEGEEWEDLITGRRRPGMKPGIRALRGSTLQVRLWEPRLLKVDDGETYYLAVTHQAQPWARDLENYEEQRYAVAVEIADQDRVELDLYALLRARVRIPSRVRLRV